MGVCATVANGLNQARFTYLQSFQTVFNQPRTKHFDLTVDSEAMT